jgi:hypothetical protein
MTGKSAAARTPAAGEAAQEEGKLEGEPGPRRVHRHTHPPLPTPRPLLVHLLISGAAVALDVFCGWSEGVPLGMKCCVERRSRGGAKPAKDRNFLLCGPAAKKRARMYTHKVFLLAPRGLEHNNTPLTLLIPYRPGGGG